MHINLNFIGSIHQIILIIHFWIKCLCLFVFKMLWLLLPCIKVCAVLCLVVQSCHLFATPWIIACQTTLPMGFPRQILGVGCLFLLQAISLTQGLNLHLLCLLHCRWILYPLNHQGNLIIYNMNISFSF